MAFKRAALVGASAFAGVIAYNLRWQHIQGQDAHILNTVVQVAPGKKIPIVLLHGMWHNPEDFKSLQKALAERGYSSHAVDLKPGERFLRGFTQKEILADLEKTLENMDKFILIGHSQGGLVAQSILQNSPILKKKISSVVLLGTFPLGLTPHLAFLIEQRQMYTFPGYLYLALFGKLFDREYVKRLFFMPSTDVEDPTFQAYIQRMLAAPSDGFITMTHFINPEPVQKQSRDIPCLVLGGEGDVVYPPEMLRSAFDDRFENATHIVAQGQAHCFADRGWEKTMAQPLIDWLDRTHDEKNK